jgi:hypothetical protein
VDWKLNKVRAGLTALAGTAIVIAAVACIAPSAASAACTGSCPPVQPGLAPPHPTITIVGAESDEPEPESAVMLGAPPFLPSLTAAYGGMPQVATDELTYTARGALQFPGPTPTATFTASAADNETELTLKATNTVSCITPLTGAYTFLTTSHDASVDFGQSKVSVSFPLQLASCPAGQVLEGVDQTASATEEISGYGYYGTPTVAYSWLNPNYDG